MLRGRRNPHKLKVIHYLAHMVELNDYLAIFTRSKESDKLRETELNGIILHITPNGCNRQDYGHFFILKLLP